MTSIAVLCPSRGRPGRFNELLKSIRETACGDKGDVHVYCGLDTDDPTGSEYPESDLVTYEVGERRPLARWLDDLAEIAIADGHSIIGFMGDDHRPRSSCWNFHIAEMLNTFDNGMAYGRDGLQDERLPTWCFWSTPIIRALGFFAPPGFQHMFLDNFWLALAVGLDRRYFLPDVVIEHLHPAAGKADMDEGYQQADSHTTADMVAWELYQQRALPEDIRRVRLAIGTLAA